MAVDIDAVLRGRFALLEAKEYRTMEGVMLLRCCKDPPQTFCSNLTERFAGKLAATDLIGEGLVLRAGSSSRCIPMRLHAALGT
eukprot:1489594-Amphidinium_carterae.1